MHPFNYCITTGCRAARGLYRSLAERLKKVQN